MHRVIQKLPNTVDAFNTEHPMRNRTKPARGSRFEQRCGGGRVSRGRGTQGEAHIKARRKWDPLAWDWARLGSGGPGGSQVWKTGSRAHKLRAGG